MKKTASKQSPKSRKKKWIILLIILAVLAGLFFYARHQMRQALEALDSPVETALVERRDLTRSITATGLVDSDNSKTIKTTLINAEVLSVVVEVGDQISAGQPICTFDTEDIAADLANARINLSVASSQSALAVGNAQRGVSDAETSRDYQLSTARKDLDNAFDQYQDALADYAEADQELADLEEDEADLEADYDKAERKYQAVEDDYQDAANAYNRAQNELGAVKAEAANLKAEAESYADQTSAEALAAWDAYNQALEALSRRQLAANAAESDYLSLKSDYDQRSAAYSAAKADYDQAKAKREAKETEAKTLEKALDQAEQAYGKAADSYHYTQTSVNSTVDGSQSALDNSRLSASTAGQTYADLVDTYSKQLAKGVLASPVSGTVTAVDIAAGDLYAGGPIVTVEDTAALVVVAEIDEYDIADVQLGMKALFKTDATRDQELEGEVIYIAPRPTESMTGEITYQVKISVDTATDRLRLGMSAKVSIIVSKTANVLAVPYDAVQTDSDGNTVVYVLEDLPAEAAAPGQAVPGKEAAAPAEPANQRAIPVTVGVEGDYYVEISGAGLKEGLAVVLPDSGYVDPISTMMAF
mgnify:CR=1 FL=1